MRSKTTNLWEFIRLERLHVHQRRRALNFQKDFAATHFLFPLLHSVDAEHEAVVEMIFPA